MKKFVSFVAAMAIMTSGASALATDVNAAAYNYNYTTARASTTKASSTKRTGKQLTYKQAYNRLKDLGFVGGTTQNNNKPANNTQTTKPTTSTKPNQNNTSTKPNQNTQQNTTGAVYMTDYKGNAISTSSLVNRSYLNRNQQYLYDTIKDAVSKGLTSVTFNNYYSRNDIVYAFNAVTADNPYLVWLYNYSNGVVDKKKGIKSINFTYDSTLVKDRAGAVQLMDDYLKPMLDKASKLSTDIDKVKFVHDWLIYNVNDGSKKSNSGSTNLYYHKVYAAVVEKQGVCESYANAFTYCMQKLGIQCTMLAGTTWSGGAHCWNLVKVGGDWYECDVYWDDVITKSETDYTYTCFMQSTASLKAYDTYNGKSRTRYSDCNVLPIAKGTKYSPDNYRYSNGSNFKDLAKVVITQRTNTSTVRGYTASANDKSLPSGWYKYKAINILGQKTINESDWTKDGNFYYIEKTNNGKTTGNYYVYDTEYDNYYYTDSSLNSISWYNYKTGVWKSLE